MAGAFDGEGKTFDICGIEGRGKGLVAARDLKGGEEVLVEPAFLQVKTFVVLKGILVWRRGHVESMYERLDSRGRDSYRALCPLGLPPLTPPDHVCEEVEDALSGTADGSGVRRRVGTVGGPLLHHDGPDRLLPPPVADMHRMIWDRNGLHFCDDNDVRANRWLHCCVFPALLSILSGSLWAFCWKGEYIRCILGACVLFFLMLGPVSVSAVYCGTQAIFLQASRLNHSCVPNAAWTVDADRGILGSPGVAPSTAACSTPVMLTLRTLRPIRKGEELVIDYIPDLVQADALTRRELLRQEYGFECSCERCRTAEQKARTRTEAEEVW